MVLRSEDASGLDLHASCEASRSLIGRGSRKQPYATIRLSTLLERVALLGFGVGFGIPLLVGHTQGPWLPVLKDSIARHCGIAVDVRLSPKMSSFGDLPAMGLTQVLYETAQGGGLPCERAPLAEA